MILPPQITITEAKDSCNFTNLHSVFVLSSNIYRSFFYQMSHLEWNPCSWSKWIYFIIMVNILIKYYFGTLFCTTRVSYECRKPQSVKPHKSDFSSFMLNLTKPSEGWTQFVPCCKIIKDNYTILTATLCCDCFIN